MGGESINCTDAPVMISFYPTCIRNMQGSAMEAVSLELGR
jgi:hypothetical protein